MASDGLDTLARDTKKHSCHTLYRDIFKKTSPSLAGTQISSHGVINSAIVLKKVYRKIFVRSKLLFLHFTERTLTKLFKVSKNLAIYNTARFENNFVELSK